MRLRSTATVTRAPDWFAPHAQSPRASLGKIMLELSILTQEQHIAVLEAQLRSGKLYGETAIELGFAEPNHVQRALEHQHKFHILDSNNDEIDHRIITAFDPHDDFSKSIRTLRGTLSSMQSMTETQIKTIAIVGVETPAETSLIAANLAVVCAQAEYRTILIDANADFPTQNRLFHLPNRIGVTTLLSTETGLVDTLQQSAMPNLRLISAGPSVPNSSELFERTPLFHRVHSLRDTYDFLIVDAGTHGINSFGAVCEGADGVVITVKKNYSHTRTLKAMITAFETRGINIIGTILTN